MKVDSRQESTPTFRSTATLVRDILERLTPAGGAPPPPLHALSDPGPVTLSWCGGPVDNGTPRTDRKRGIPERTKKFNGDPSPFILDAQ